MARFNEFFVEPRRSKFTEVGGLSTPPSGKPAANADGMDGPNVTLPNDRTDKKSKAFAHIADEERVASEAANELSGEGDKPSYDLTPIKRLLANHGEIIAKVADQRTIEILTKLCCVEPGASEVSESFPWTGKPISEQRLRSFAASLRE